MHCDINQLTDSFKMRKFQCKLIILCCLCKESELQLIRDENREKLGQRDHNISLLESELKKLQENIQRLSTEIEIKKEEVGRVKSEASEQLR